jgi:predicted ATPase
MLTRLKVNGFKNLVDVDVRFGPFTCIAGVNGSGKSNLFDAIRFLAALAEKPLVEAALSIRGGSRSADIRDLFHRVGDQYADEMSFEAEMIIPAEGIDDLGQPVYADATYLRYVLLLSYRRQSGPNSSMPLQIEREELVPTDLDSTEGRLVFPHELVWRGSAIKRSSARTRPLISYRSGQRVSIVSGPPPYSGTSESGVLVTSMLPRTVLSSAAVAIDPLAVLVQREMRSWRVIQLDPTAMRISDSLDAPADVGPDGSHLAATLYSVAHLPPSNRTDPAATEAAVYARVRNRLFQLIGEMREITVERDDKREELTLYATGRDGTTLPARALSDGTLRFLALAVLEQQEQPGLYCIEEPENGIHPGRIQALLDLLEAIALDTRYPIEDGNPLRQMIISTHSPSVVMRVPADSLVVAELWPSHDDRGRFKRARFRGLAGSWRDPSPSMDSLAFGTLLEYLNPEGYRPLPRPDPERDPDAAVRVMDQADIRRILSPIQPD